MRNDIVDELEVTSRSVENGRLKLYHTMYVEKYKDGSKLYIQRPLNSLEKFKKCGEIGRWQVIYP